jgi:hypothetical protein
MWWARQDLNLRPLACEASALPLSYAPGSKHDSTGFGSQVTPSLTIGDGGACPRRAAVIAEPHSSDRPSLALATAGRKAQIRPLTRSDPAPRPLPASSVLHSRGERAGER